MVRLQAMVRGRIVRRDVLALRKAVGTIEVRALGNLGEWKEGGQTAIHCSHEEDVAS